MPSRSQEKTPESQMACQCTVVALPHNDEVVIVGPVFPPTPDVSPIRPVRPTAEMEEFEVLNTAFCEEDIEDEWTYGQTKVDEVIPAGGTQAGTVKIIVDRLKAMIPTVKVFENPHLKMRLPEHHAMTL